MVPRVHTVKGPMGNVRKARISSKRTPRPAVAVTSATPAGQALRDAMGLLLAFANDQAALAVRSGDPEPIHDYRVALRILRALVSASKRELPSGRVERIGDLLRRLARETGALRDLDVLLESRRALEKKLPSKQRKGLCPLWERLEARRTQERQRLAERLALPGHSRVLAKLDVAVAGLRLHAPWEGLPVALWLGPALDRRRRKLRKLARKTVQDPSDTNLHALRIGGKKLRYVVESFGEALPATARRTVLRRVKAFQDTLGRVHDLACQRDTLLGLQAEWFGSHPEESTAAGRLAMAVERLRKKARREGVTAARAVMDPHFERAVASLQGR